MNKLIPLITRCKECNYTAMTWHRNRTELENCSKRYCNKGKLEVLAEVQLE